MAKVYLKSYLKSQIFHVIGSHFLLVDLEKRQTQSVSFLVQQSLIQMCQTQASVA